MHCLLGAALAVLVLLSAPAEARRSRAQAHWGGPDLPFACATVRANRAWIEALSAEARAALARQFNINRKQRRQAVACLREK